MQKTALIWFYDPSVDIKIRTTRRSTASLLTSELANHRPPRMAAPRPRRRHACLTRSPLLAALREAEFDDWQASGGDFLTSRHRMPG